jgi:hypothetical protein
MARAEGAASMRSPSASATTPMASPPTSICPPARIMPGGEGIRLLASEPIAQPIGASSSIATPAGLPRSSPPRFITPTPIRPITTPAISSRDTGSPTRRPNTVIHSGIVATSTAATPVDTERSATLMRPLPMTKRKTPATATPSHCGRVGHASPRSRAKPSIKTPEARKRAAPSRKGGKLSSAMAMPR